MSRLNHVFRWFNLNVLVNFQTFVVEKNKMSHKVRPSENAGLTSVYLGITSFFGRGYTNHPSCVQRGHKPPKSEGLKVGLTCCFGQTFGK